MDELRLVPNGWVPDACTLPTAERPVRRAEFDNLFTAVKRVIRDDPRHARFAFATTSDDFADRVRDLAARESECCSFFGFTVSSSADVVLLDVTVPDAHVGMLDALVTRAGSIRAAQ